LSRYTTIPATETLVVGSWQTAAAGAPNETVTRPIWRASCAFFDTAATAKTTSDYSAVCVGTIDRNRNTYVQLIERRRVEFNDLVRFVGEVYSAYTPDYVVIEKSLHGLPVLQELRRGTGIPVLGVTPIGDKVSRAQVILPWCECGRIRFPAGAPWVEDALDEICQFPHGRFDDRVDAFVGCVTWLLGTVDSSESAAQNRRRIRGFFLR
jgi:predicted phage terminase large subunit-like protein